MDKEKIDILECILGLKELPNRKSCLQLALESARFHLGRNIKTGEGSHVEFYCRHMDREIIVAEESDLFSGTVLYLIALEQIGELFTNGNNNCVIRALQNFSSLEYKDCLYIKHLRNSLAHNFGLVSTYKGTPKYKFTLVKIESSNKVVIPPSKDWDGYYFDKREDSSVIINVFALANLVEGVIKKLKEKRSELIFKFERIEEIRSRFTIVIE